MSSKLTLSVAPEVVAAAKRYAAAKDTSVSQLVEDYLSETPGAVSATKQLYQEGRPAALAHRAHRLPGNSATTVSASARPSARRLSARGTSSGMLSASGWPTKLAWMPCAA